MWIILVSLLAGILTGVFRILPQKVVKFNSRFQQIGVILLIFSMGAAIGSNRELIEGLQTMGARAVVFALLTSICSVTVLYIISSKFMGDKKIK